MFQIVIKVFIFVRETLNGNHLSLNAACALMGRVDVSHSS